MTMNTQSAEGAYAGAWLLLMSLVLVLAGGAYIVLPDTMLAFTGRFQLDAAATVDARATYGGLQVALGLYLYIEQRRIASRSSLLRLLAIVLGGVGVVRLGFAASAGLAPVQLPLHLAAAGVELLAAFISLRLSR